MEQISFRLEVFEGPLDVLLNLIRKHRLDICDIEISELLRQYLDFMEECQENNLELAGEFLEMASRLIYIKTASLLPHPEEAQKLKKELEGVLIEYSLCKLTAQKLAEKFNADIFVRKPMKIKSDMVYSLVHSPERLVFAYKTLSERKADRAEKIEGRINSVVKRRIVSVTTKVVHVLRELYRTGEADIERLFDGVTDRSARVATFLAVLELTKSGRICISDDNTKIFMNRRKEGIKSWKSAKN
ncbi:MAG: segregation/condensation protein A [Ruminococcus sp.]|nr:segregation/condensation protein A [Ruminococcus sp.]